MSDPEDNFLAEVVQLAREHPIGFVLFAIGVRPR